MKRAYLVNGTITDTANARDNTLSVDSDTWTYLAGLLDDDYCYLMLGNLEVVKVQSVQAPNVALVARALDGTNRRTWVAGTKLKYALTRLELDDAVTASVINLDVEYPISEVNGVLAYADLEIAGIGGLAVGGSGIEWLIQDIPSNAGCCPSSGPPPIPLSYYKLRVVTEGYYRATSDGSYREYL